MALTRQPAVTIQDILNSRNTTASQPTPLFMKSAANQYPAPTYSGGAGTGNILGPAVPAAAPAPVATGGGYGPGGAPAPVVEPTPPPSDNELLFKDAMWQTQINALNAARDRYVAGIESDIRDYSTNYADALRKMGFKGDVAKAEGDKNYVSGIGDWNQTDTTTASGKGFESMLNDFAARGMLKSTAYTNAYNNLLRSLGEQLSSSAQAKVKTTADLQRQIADKKAETEASKTTGAQEALARIKASFGYA